MKKAAVCVCLEKVEDWLTRLNVEMLNVTSTESEAWISYKWKRSKGVDGLT
jgi:hypothetical protein